MEQMQEYYKKIYEILKYYDEKINEIKNKITGNKNSYEEKIQNIKKVMNETKESKSTPENLEILANCERNISDLEEKKQIEMKELRIKEQFLKEDLLEYLEKDEIKNFISLLKSDNTAFSNGAKYNGDVKQCNYISIGTKRVELPIITELKAKISMELDGMYDAKTDTLNMPVNMELSKGANYLIEYENETENELMSGVQQFLLNIAKYFGKYFKQILFIDPIRYSSSALGILAQLSEGRNSFIDNVPSNEEEIKSKLSSIIMGSNTNKNSLTQKEEVNQKRLLIIHDFPFGYNSDILKLIQQICANADNYNVIVIMTYNNSVKECGNTTLMNFIKNNSITPCQSNMFEWYIAPQILPEYIKEMYVNNKYSCEEDNDYEKRIGWTNECKYKKGVREIVDIPYGIDTYGNILKLDFENSNFATFICGASRSGKSTLLNTIITGIIKNRHPDDVEIWLIDFKMTEFSRYIKHLPPHIRYIILDESPELVYDIIDRLTEIMNKRQNIFKGKWQKSNEVPSEKYMPAIFVVIDEFSVMSNIIADSVNNGKEDYRIKLQTLLAKGAALGFHFIFASQGFSKGTRGLNDFSKQQIQQRIAMKTEYDDIRTTLDLRTTSEYDKQLMEQLPAHYTLTKNEIDNFGNHLTLSKVIYISDYGKQEEFIEEINKQMSVQSKYDKENEKIYIDKKTMIIDGNVYVSYAEKEKEMDEYISKNINELIENKETVLFIGEPRRMMYIYPIKVENSFCENMLIVGPSSENTIITSILESSIESLKKQKVEIELWANRRNEMYCQLMKKYNKSEMLIADELEEFCKRVKSIKEKILAREEGNRYIILLGSETILFDMKYCEFNTKEEKKNNNIFEKIIRDDDEMDLENYLKMLENETDDQKERNKNVNVLKNDIKLEECESEIYDATEDLKFILTQGPRLGYHIITTFRTIGDLKQNRIDSSLFKHKVFFRLPSSELFDVVRANEARNIAELSENGEHSYRYTNELESVSFRPYLHSGLSWDGWQVQDNKVVNIVEEEEEYLL